MALQWENIDQSSKFISSHFFYPFYSNLSPIAQQKPVIALGAPLIGVIDGAVSFVEAISGIGEAAIKGIGNLFQGMIQGDRPRLKRGSLQLILGVGVIGLLALPVIAARVLRITGGMLFFPEETSARQAENYRNKNLGSFSLV